MHAAQIAAWLAPEDLQITMNATLLAARNWLSLFHIDNRPLDETLAMIQEQVVVAEVLRIFCHWAMDKVELRSCCKTVLEVS
jgi:hypothetical protein